MGCRPLQNRLGCVHSAQAGVSVYLCGERTAAAAASRGIGILKNKSLTHQGFFVLEDGSGKIQKALWIDEDARTEFLENFIAIARLRIETHRIRKPRATAALHTDAKASLIEGHAVFFQ